MLSMTRMTKVLSVVPVLAAKFHTRRLGIGPVVVVSTNDCDCDCDWRRRGCSVTIASRGICSLSSTTSLIASLVCGQVNSLDVAFAETIAFAADADADADADFAVVAEVESAMSISMST